MSRIPRRDVNGILLLDKPLGRSSNAALQDVKRLFGARKAGHTGSLDPLAGGLLPLCFGEATKVSSFLLDAAKCYRLRCRLGVTTTTGDAEGEVLETRSVPPLTRAGMEAVLARFIGRIEQVPPMYSALKHQGQRLYRLARQGVEVERKPREVEIHGIALLDLGPDELGFEVRCSKGTYVRTLAEDIGRMLGCGAHVTDLRRTALGPFDEGSMVTLETVRERAAQGKDALDALLVPMDRALEAWPSVRLNPDSAYFIRQGQPVQVPHAPVRGWVRLYAEQGFMGLGEIMDDGRVAPRRLLNQSHRPQDERGL